MKRAVLLAASIVTMLVALGVLRGLLRGDRPGGGAGTDSREVLKVGFLPVT